MPTGMTYKAAGVDIDAGNEFAGMIKARVAAAWPDIGEEIGGFAGGGPIPSGAKKVKGCTDGPGSKIILAAIADDFSGIGQDVVAMSAVDADVGGNKPAYLWDYMAVAKLVPQRHITIIDSIIAACKLAGCKLAGGETAELPDLFRFSWMCDVATFVIGFPRPGFEFFPVRLGQELWAYPSYGLGSNGLSLARKAFNLKAKPSVIKKRLESRIPEVGATLADELLRPTPIWISALENDRQRGVRFAGHAHITGGGMVDNIPRMLPKQFKAVIQRDQWSRPKIFSLIQRRGNVPDYDMDRTFNQGVMIVSLVDPGGSRSDNPHCFKIGEVRSRVGNEPQVELVGSYRDD